MADDGWRSANRREVMTRDWWFRDRGTGEIVIAQFPNVALWIFLGSVVVRAGSDGRVGAGDGGG